MLNQPLDFSFTFNLSFEGKVAIVCEVPDVDASLGTEVICELARVRGIGGTGSDGVACGRPFAENECLDGLCRRLPKKPLVLALGELATGVDAVIGIEGSGSGIETLRGAGEDATIVGFETAGEAGVPGANSLASESPSWVRPGGKAGACMELMSETEFRAKDSSLRPRAWRSISTA